MSCYAWNWSKSLCAVWWVCKPIVVLSLVQAEQKQEFRHGGELIQNGRFREELIQNIRNFDSSLLLFQYFHIIVQDVA